MYEGSVQDLIDELGRLPGVGPKSAQRIAFHLLDADKDEVQQLVDAITTVKTSVSFCQVCGNVTEQEECAICRDARRDRTVICVVEDSKDVMNAPAVTAGSTTCSVGLSHPSRVWAPISCASVNS